MTLRISSAPPCNLCSSSTVFFMEVRGFSIFRCETCDFKFAHLPEDFDTSALYSDDSYWTGGDHGYSDYREEWKLSERYYRARLARINAMTKPGRMLEIGCAAGYFLKAAHDERWEVAGVEISDT